MANDDEVQIVEPLTTAAAAAAAAAAVAGNAGEDVEITEDELPKRVTFLEYDPSIRVSTTHILML